MKNFFFFLSFLLIFTVPAQTFSRTDKVQPFQKFLDRFPDVFCNQSDECKDAFFLTGADCKGYLKKQITQKYAGKKFRVSSKKVDSCLASLATAGCEVLKTSVPEECGFLNKL